MSSLSSMVLLALEVFETFINVRNVHPRSRGDLIEPTMGWPLILRKGKCIFGHSTTCMTLSCVLAECITTQNSSGGAAGPFLKQSKRVA